MARVVIAGEEEGVVGRGGLRGARRAGRGEGQGARRRGRWSRGAGGGRRRGGTLACSWNWG